jgi:hypothetical protein
MVALYFIIECYVLLSVGFKSIITTMKNTIIVLLFLVPFLTTRAQLVTTDPQFPTPGQPVTIYFNAAEGSLGLMGYTGDVYAHTGVITSASTNGSDWKHVKTNWGVNTAETKLTRIDGDLYSLQITPSINSYYGVGTSETVLQMAFVFRSSDGSKTGKTATGGDIFIDVYDLALSVNILKPVANTIVKVGETVDIEAASILSDSLILYIDNQRVGVTNTNSISFNYTVENYGKHWIKAEAKTAAESVFDSVFIFVRQPNVLAELPAGVKKGINYIDDQTVTLVLYAPEKEFVFLQGDFNDWDYTQALSSNIETKSIQQVSTTSWLMNETPDSLYYWQTITGLTPGQEYAFQYLVDGTINIADPYTEKILDPWNDGYISSSTYPNLKAYPQGKATEAVSVFQTAQTVYPWDDAGFTPPAKSKMVIYELHVRDFVGTHTYKTIIDTLDYLQNLGINVLELMPVNEFEGNSGWGYNPSFYFAPDKYYGPKNDLKALVNECHKRGIAVVIDMVLNHSYGQSPFVRLYFENGKPAANNPWYNVNSNFTNPDAQWGYDFNHESAATQELVDSINSFWMSQYHVDGFRFDFTKGFGNNIKDASDPWGSKYDADRIRLLERMADQLWKRNPDGYVICEHLADNSEEKVLANYGLLLWGNLNYAYCEASMGYVATSDLSQISYKNRGWSTPALVGYMESHDEERQMYKNLTYGNSNGSYNTKDLSTALRRAELCVNFFLPIPGPKMIWQFGELGYDESIETNGRLGEKPLHWEYFTQDNRKRLYQVYAALAKLKATEPVFETTDFTSTLNASVKSIHLNGDDMKVTILGNFDVVEKQVNPNFQQTGWWYELYSGDSIEVSDVNAQFTFAPGEYRFYTTKKLEKPDINSAVFDTPDADLLNPLVIYPNPVENSMWIANREELNELQVYNSMGGMVLNFSHVIVDQKIDISALSKGIYIVKATGVNGLQYIGKVIKN